MKIFNFVPFNPVLRQKDDKTLISLLFLYLNLASLSPSETTCRMLLHQLQPVALRRPAVSLDSASDLVLSHFSRKHEI